MVVKMMIMMKIQVSDDSTVFISLTIGSWGLEVRKERTPGTCHFFHLSKHTMFIHPSTFSNSKPVPEGGTGTRDIAASMAALARSVHMR